MSTQRSKKQDAIDLFNVQAERTVLGKILGNPSVFWELDGTLQSMHFSREIYRDIYDALYRLMTSGAKYTLVSLRTMLPPEYEDGQSTIVLITGMIRESEEVEDISEPLAIIIDLWRRRRTIDVCKQFASEALKKDADTAYMLTDFENVVKDIQTMSQDQPIMTVGSYAGAVLRNAKKAQETGVSVGIGFGLPSLTEIAGKMHAGDLGYVMAPQGHGKTVVGWHIAKSSAEQSKPSCFFQLEMSGEDMAGRALAQSADVSISSITEGSYDSFQWSNLVDAQKDLETLPIYIDARPLLPVEKIRERAIALKQTKGLELIVIDHARLVQSMKRFNNKFDRVEYVSSFLKGMAKELQIIVVALSQVSRASQRRDDPFPQIADSDLGSAVEQDADWVLALFRRDYWMRQNRPHDFTSQAYEEWSEEYRKHINTMDIRCLKRRRGEPMLEKRFIYHGAQYQIAELER